MIRRSDEDRQLQMPPSTGRQWRKRLALGDELLLAVVPTATILIVLLVVEVLSRQQVLFASLAASAFLIYLDPSHAMNSIRTLVFSQMGAAVIGWLAFLALGGDYLSGGVAMIVTIVLMIVFDILHPPAVATSLSFAFRTGDEQNLIIFALAVGITAVLVLVQRAVAWMLARRSRDES